MRLGRDAHNGRSLLGRLTSSTVTVRNQQALIQRLLAGDQAAYREVVAACHGAMLATARALVGEAVAEEVVQEAWLSAIQALPRFEGRSSLKTWLIRITANRAKSRLRRDKRTVNYAFPEELEGRFDERGHWSQPPRPWGVDERPDALLEAAQLKARLQRAMDRLPPLQRAVVTLRDGEGLAFADICKILDISESNARVLLHRARLRLWAAVDEMEN